MSERKEITGLNLFQIIHETIQEMTVWGLNNFVLEGPLINQSVELSSFLALFPQKEGDFVGVAIVPEKNQEALFQFYQKICRLKIPERVKNLKMKDISPLAQAITSNCASNFRPSLIIGIGKTSISQEEVILLFCPWGMPPEKALEQIQSYASSKRDEIASKNN
ncbi:MAG: hypothetical protein ACPLKP_03965 [Microgenomates group bacterium]